MSSFSSCARCGLDGRGLEPVHPANAEAIAEFAEETGAEVLRGALHYPSESGDWQLGDIDFGEHLAKYRDQQAVVVVSIAQNMRLSPFDFYASMYSHNIWPWSFR